MNREYSATNNSQELINFQNGYYSKKRFHQQQVCLTCLQINNAYNKLHDPEWVKKTQAGVQHLLNHHIFKDIRLARAIVAYK